MAEIRNLSRNEEFLEDFYAWSARLHSYPNYPYGEKYGDFPCPLLSKTPSDEPITVHKLHPGDVQCVGAIGDSLTAALGAAANTPIGLVTENRGASWAVGADESYETRLTLPNVLLNYNPKLRGYSTGNDILFFNNQNATRNGLNVARTSAVSSDTFDEARNLLARLQTGDYCDLQNDWKVITYFIGGNDLCLACQDTNEYNPTAYRDHVKKVLDFLYENVPRTFVNLVLVLDVRFVEELNKGGSFCQLMHSRTCPCGAFPTDADRALLNEYVPKYQELLVDLVNSGIYDTRDDFTVVIQPFLAHTPLPMDGDLPDYSYFSTDCFHFSIKGHARAALALWNNMFEVVGEKKWEWHKGEQIQCPDPARPYFSTRKNSPQAFERIPPRTWKK